MFWQKAFCKESILFHIYPFFDFINGQYSVFIVLRYPHTFSSGPLYLSSSASIETQTGTEYQDTRSVATRSKSDPTFKPEDILLHMRVLQVDRKTIFTQTFTVGDLIERRINDPLLFDLNIDEPVLELPYVKPADGSGASGFDAEVEDWIVIDNQIRF